MMPTQRRQAILAEVRKASAASAEDLGGMRDHGLLERVYGGALSVQSSEGTFAARSTRHHDRKRAIAALAASLGEPQDTIVIDIGTTALEVARGLPADFRGRVLTNSVPVALELSAREEVELLLSGGQVRAGDAACYGATADAFFGQVYADKAFLGSGGVHAEAGLTDYYPHEVAARRVMIAHAGASFVLADSSKLGKVAVHRVCALTQVTAIITNAGDSKVEAEGADALAAAGCDVLRAPLLEATPLTPFSPREMRYPWIRSPRRLPRTLSSANSATVSSSPARCTRSSRSPSRSRSSRSRPASSPPMPSPSRPAAPGPSGPG